MTDTNSLRTVAGYALEVGLYAIHMAMTEAADTIETLHAQLTEAQRDSERLDWLDKYCTGASDSERYLPRKIYWGGGSHRDVRAAIDTAKEPT